MNTSADSHPGEVVFWGGRLFPQVRGFGVCEAEPRSLRREFFCAGVKIEGIIRSSTARIDGKRDMR